MAAEIPKIEPTEITAGDTLKFTISLSDYLPADGWTLSYALVNKDNQIDITGSDNGDGSHLISVAKATTKGWVAGTYDWQAYVDNGTERYKVREGQLEILADFASQSNYDARSHVKKVLDAVEAVLEGRASKDQESYTINGRSLSRTSIPDLMKLRDRYRAEYENEIRAERIARGLGHSGIIRVRM